MVCLALYCIACVVLLGIVRYDKCVQMCYDCAVQFADCAIHTGQDLTHLSTWPLHDFGNTISLE
jgi:hypothetical protein